MRRQFWCMLSSGRVRRLVLGVKASIGPECGFEHWLSTRSVHITGTDTRTRRCANRHLLRRNSRSKARPIRPSALKLTFRKIVS
jgi:hypothetical protein